MVDTVINKVIYGYSFLQTSISAKLLVEELQLGKQLSQSIQGNRRSDFSLLLAMLADDVRAHSQFSLPTSSNVQEKKSSSALRKYFDLPNETPLGLNSIDDIDKYGQAELINKNTLVSLHLSDCLQPKPLAFRDNKAFVNTDVLSNTSVYCQQQHLQPTEKNRQKRRFDANNWLKNVQNTLVKAPLLAV